MSFALGPFTHFRFRSLYPITRTHLLLEDAKRNGRAVERMIDHCSSSDDFKSIPLAHALISGVPPMDPTDYARELVASVDEMEANMRRVKFSNAFIERFPEALPLVKDGKTTGVFFPNTTNIEDIRGEVEELGIKIFTPNDVATAQSIHIQPALAEPQPIQPALAEPIQPALAEPQPIQPAPKAQLILTAQPALTEPATEYQRSLLDQFRRRVADLP